MFQASPAAGGGANLGPSAGATDGSTAIRGNVCIVGATAGAAGDAISGAIEDDGGRVDATAEKAMVRPGVGATTGDGVGGAAKLVSAGAGAGGGVGARRRGVLATGIASGGTANECTGVVRVAFSTSADANASERFLPTDGSARESIPGVPS